MHFNSLKPFECKVEMNIFMECEELLLNLDTKINYEAIRSKQSRIPSCLGPRVQSTSLFYFFPWHASTHILSLSHTWVIQYSTRGTHINIFSHFEKLEHNIAYIKNFIFYRHILYNYTLLCKADTIFF
jgi:hypothetical protein